MHPSGRSYTVHGRGCEVTHARPRGFPFPLPSLRTSPARLASSSVSSAFVDFTRSPTTSRARARRHSRHHERRSGGSPRRGAHPQMRAVVPARTE
ncbi:hypothetical protein, conserved [Leishmania donovani]|uniref:Uncharacterized protein n=1 Tax=Leishmania donovani TaxID=5661 RepID=E9BAZ8_LEIDO|nr:hypothetical protein, conserved [Leishmania donovani]AYU76933.1 hypothetical protein LdCL_120007350 [Leishmania donovani]CBZ32423.1 hypothetical protein, conserved [Leishmania donovani]